MSDKRNLATIALILLFAATLVTAFLFQKNLEPFFMLLVFLAAASGSLVNLSLSPVDESWKKLSTREQVSFFSWKIIVAIVFSALLYCIFIAQIISGSLFPDFPRSIETYIDVETLLEEVKPGSNADAAKMIVWAFVAGYAEKFVPNLITRLKSDA